MIDFYQIKKLLPHRYPMLLIDRIIEFEMGSHCTAIKNITLNEYCYDDIDESVPKEGYAYPKSLMIESFSQAAALLCLISNREKGISFHGVMLFGTITGFSFHAPVYPGDVMIHKVRIEKDLTDAFIITGEIWVEAKKVAEVEREIVVIRPDQEVFATSN